MTAIRHPITVVEIVQPACAESFGVAPCLGVGKACYGTDGTCRYRPALDLSGEVVLRFVEDQGWPWYPGVGAFQPCLAIPSLLVVDVTPTVLNVAARSNAISPLGLEGSCSIRLRNHPYNDHGLDPNAATRSHDPMAQGTYWGKFLARNPRHIGWTVRIYEGEAGQALADMVRRDFDLEKISLAGGEAQVTGRTVMRRVTDSGVTAPERSPGILASLITAGATSLEIAGAALADYPAPGRVRIGSEVLGYTAVAVAGSNITLTGLSRGDLDTLAAEHAQNDQVQWVLSYVAQRFVDIAYDLTVTRSGVPAAVVDMAEWDEEQDDWRATYIFTRHITSATPIKTLMTELCLEAQVHLWWDERAHMFRLRAQRPDFAPVLLSDADNILQGSFSVVEKPEERVSEVWVYYGLRSPVADEGQDASWRDCVIYLDVEKSVQYAGQRQVRRINAKWLDTRALALTLATSYGRRHQDVRREVTFSVAPQDVEALWTGSSVNIRHFDISDDDGAALVSNWLITSAEPVAVGASYRFVAEDNGSGGVLWLLQDATVAPADWSAATPAERETIPFLLDENGLDPGGTPRPWRLL